jgi:hypothetical protein
MTLPITLALLAASGALAALFGWLGARPRHPLKPRLAPWQLMMMISAAFAILMIVHLMTLFGAPTGGNRQF